MVASDIATAAHDVLAFVRSTLLHYGYSGRISTAGNLAFPCSPSDIETELDGKPCSFFIAGTRDPVFCKQWPEIQEAVLSRAKSMLPGLTAICQITIYTADAHHPIAFIESIDDNRAHGEMLAAVQKRRDHRFSGLEDISIGDVYEWSVHHLLSDQSILDQLFPVQIKHWDGNQWEVGDRVKCNWKNRAYSEGPDPNPSLAFTPDLPLKNTGNTMDLIDMADVIRSKNAGINEITFDILFSNEGYFHLALESGAFTVDNMGKVLNLPYDAFVGSFHYPIVRAVKLTIHRECLAGSPGDRDVFGAQQQGRILAMKIPVQ